MKRRMGSDEGSKDARTYAEVAYARIKKDIQWGRLEPDQALRSDALRERYELGVSPLREALMRLTTERLVVNTGQRGFRVEPLTVEIVRDTAEARITLESEAIRRSIELGDSEWETRVVAATYALTRLPKDEEQLMNEEMWSDRHRDYHMALLSACGSPWLLHMSELLYAHAERHRIVALKKKLAIEAVGVINARDRVQEHKKLADLVLAGDVEATVNFLRRHYTITMQMVISALNEPSSEPAPVVKKVKQRRRA